MLRVQLIETKRQRALTQAQRVALQLLVLAGAQVELVEDERPVMERFRLRRRLRRRWAAADIAAAI